MAPLHAMNPLRIGWIDRRIQARFGEPQRVLDIGCGAGLAAEALARIGHTVLGLDAAGDVIAAAQAHAAGQDLPLTYRAGTAEGLVAEGAKFPVVTALEVIEHVADPAAFLRLLARLVSPGGVLFVSTLNRTARSLVVAKFGAEYVMRMLPIGTHDWRRFVTPAELDVYGRAAGFRTRSVTGMSYDFRHGIWRASADLSINFMSELTHIG